MTVRLVDFSWARPGGAAIKAEGFAGVVRYVPYPGDGGKGLTADEVEDYHVNGLSIALVFESTGERPRGDSNQGGFSKGQEDAGLCLTAGVWLGFPSDRPFYFAVDFDAQGPEIADYFRGAVSVLGKRTGVYGSRRVLEYLRAHALAYWFWQTYAWSYGQNFDGRHIFQYQNGQTINGGAVDLNEAYGDDYGQWPATQEEDMADPRVDELIAKQTELNASVVKRMQIINLATGTDGSGYPRMLEAWDALAAKGLVK